MCVGGYSPCSIIVCFFYTLRISADVETPCIATNLISCVNSVRL